MAVVVEPAAEVDPGDATDETVALVVAAALVEPLEATDEAVALVVAAAVVDPLEATNGVVALVVAAAVVDPLEATDGEVALVVAAAVVDPVEAADEAVALVVTAAVVDPLEITDIIVVLVVAAVESVGVGSLFVVVGTDITEVDAGAVLDPEDAGVERAVEEPLVVDENPGVSDAADEVDDPKPVVSIGVEAPPDIELPEDSAGVLNPEVGNLAVEEDAAVTLGVVDPPEADDPEVIPAVGLLLTEMKPGVWLEEAAEEDAGDMPGVEPPAENKVV